MTYSEYSSTAPKEPGARDPFSAPTRSSLGEEDYRPGYRGKPPDREPNVDPARFTYPVAEPTRVRSRE